MQNKGATLQSKNTIPHRELQNIHKMGSHRQVHNEPNSTFHMEYTVPSNKTAKNILTTLASILNAKIEGHLI